MILLLVACAGAPEVHAELHPDTHVLSVTSTAPVTLTRDGRPVASRRSEDGRSLQSAGPLKAGATYVAIAGSTTVSVVVPDAPPEPPPTVHVLPDVPVLPSNHLKLYLDFSRPMHRGPDLYDHLSLVDETTGQAVPAAFFEHPSWNADATGLTVLLHPGRQKRDLSFGADLGPVLVEGHAYALHIDGLTAADGSTLEPTTGLRFRAGPADREGPDPARWTVDPPRESTDPLIVVLDEPGEPRLLAAAFVVTAGRSEIPTTSSVQPGSTRVEISPREPWPAGTLELQQRGWIEDLAGNTPGRAFDHEAGVPAAEPTFTRTFEVRAAREG